MFPTNYTATTDDCNVQQHNSFEDEYFDFILSGYWHTITQDNGGKVLTLTNAIFGHAIFKNYPLSISDFQNNEFQVYPNPVKNELFLTSINNAGNLKVKIFNIEGKLLNIQNLNFEKQTTIDVSHLSRGIYFLNIEDENGIKTVKKFIKE